MRPDLSRRGLLAVAAAATTFRPDQAAAQAGTGIEMSVNRRGFCCLSCSPDGRRLATGGLDGAVRLWDVERGLPLHQAVISSQEVFSLAWDAPGRRLAAGTGDGRVVLLNPDDSGVLVERSVPGPVTALSWLPDGLLAIGAMGGHISLHEPDDLAPRRAFQIRSGLLAGAVLPDGSAMVVSNPGRRISLADGAVLAEMPGGGGTHAFAVSRDGRLVAATHWSGELRLWRDGAEPRSIRPMIPTRVAGPQNASPVDLAMPMTGVAISPDAAVVVAASVDRRVRFWSAVTGDLIATTPRLAKTVSALAFAPDGRHLCLADLGGVVRLWPVEEGLPPAALRA